MTKAWRYGDAGDIYPVRPGQVWQVGKHKFICDCLESRLERGVKLPQCDVVDAGV